MNTIFSKIISREIPAHIIYEDELVLSFLDITPVNHGHTLIIPKKHFTNIFDANPEVLGHMMGVAQKISNSLIKAGLADGVNLIMNNGEEAGQEVFHAHLHVIPRIKDDHSFSKPVHVNCTDEELLRTKNRLTEILT